MRRYRLLAVSSILAATLVGPSSASAQTADVLNEFAKTRAPLADANYRLRLTRIIVDTNLDDDGYGYGYNRIAASVAEALPPASFDFVTPNASMALNVDRTWAQIFRYQTVEAFSAALPKIEILRNKLVTFSYPDGSTESLLFNVDVPTKDSNNHRQYVRILLADEIVGDTDRDIEWRVFWLGDDAYIALNHEQLERLNVLMSSDASQIAARDPNDTSERWSEAFDPYSSSDDVSLGTDWFIYRKRDEHMAASYWVPPAAMTFIFKLDVVP